MPADTYDDEPDVDWEPIVRAVHEVRESLVALATARLIGEDDTPALQAHEEVMAGLEVLNQGLLPAMLVRVLWDGSRSAEGEARRRLKALRNAGDIGPLMDVIARTPGGAS